MKYYLIEGMTRLVNTDLYKGAKSEDWWLSHLQSLPNKLPVHIDLEKQLAKAGYRDGDEVPANMFIRAAVPVSMEDQFTA